MEDLAEYAKRLGESEARGKALSEANKLLRFEAGERERRERENERDVKRQGNDEKR